MNILITNHWLAKLGGSETFTYTLAQELRRRKINTYLFANVKGPVYNRIKKDFGVKDFVEMDYDLILANHKTTVEKIHKFGRTIQTCHGYIPKLEQPNTKASFFVAISKEVKTHIGKETGYVSKVIWNGINCDTFTPNKLNPKLKTVLSLAHSDEANNLIKQACDNLGLTLITIDKYKNPKWGIQDYINSADLVISLARGAYESFACGKPVIVFDSRPYQESFADGYVTEDNILEMMKNNCTGRRFKMKYGVKEIESELKKYNPKDGEFLRDFAVEHLNIKKQVDKYLSL